MGSSIALLLLRVGTTLALGAGGATALAGCGSSAGGAGDLSAAPGDDDAGVANADGRPHANGGGAEGGSLGEAGGAGNGEAGPPPSTAWTIPSGPPDCDPTKPFGAPVVVPGAPLSWLAGASLSPDERVLFVSVPDPNPTKNVHRIAQAVRADRSLPFGAPTILTSVHGTYPDEPLSNPRITADGLTIFYGNGGGFMRATRASVAAPFGTPTVLHDGSADVDTQVLSGVSPDGSSIYVSRYDRSSLYRFPSHAPLGLGVVEAPINAPIAPSTHDGDVFMAALSHDGKTIIYRKTLDSNDNGAIYAATRASTTVTFSGATVLSEFPVKKQQSFPVWLSPDQCRLYLEVGLGLSAQIVVATRPH